MHIISNNYLGQIIWQINYLMNLNFYPTDGATENNSRAAVTADFDHQLATQLL